MHLIGVAVARDSSHSDTCWLFDDSTRRLARPHEASCTGMYIAWVAMKSYRPMALQQALTKVVTGIVAARLTEAIVFALYSTTLYETLY